MRLLLKIAVIIGRSCNNETFLNARQPGQYLEVDEIRPRFV